MRAVRWTIQRRLNSWLRQFYRRNAPMPESILWQRIFFKNIEGQRITLRCRKKNYSRTSAQQDFFATKRRAFAGQAQSSLRSSEEKSLKRWSNCWRCPALRAKQQMSFWETLFTLLPESLWIRMWVASASVWV